jgi:uncharacterized protein (UPF0332 family)
VNDAAGEFEQAERCLRSCKLLLADDDSLGAVNRLYYALYHAACAALTHRGVEIPKTHSGLIARFGETFVKPGILPSFLGRLLNQAEHQRLLSDYSDDQPDPGLLPDLMTQAEAFLSAIHSLISD